MVLAVAVMAPMTRTESTGPYSMASGPSSAPTGPLPRGRPRPAHRHRRRLGQAGERGRDGGRIIVTVVSTSRLPVVAEMSRGRGRASRRARPHAAAAACAGVATRKPSGKTGEAARALARADGQRNWRRAEAGAPRRARSRAGAGADIALAHAASCACACSMRTGLARAAAGPTEAAPHAWRPAGPGGTCGWWVGIPGL